MSDSRRPNILHLFTDMQRFDTIHAMGNGVIKTPNLDRLCGEGVVFTNAFSPSPVCISARCSMIYGQYPMNTGCYENTQMPSDGRHTFMESLKDAGYSTHGIGKCHFTPNPYALKGFQSREIQEEGGATEAELDDNDYLSYLREKGYDHVHEAYGVRGEMYYIPQISQLPAEDHPTQWVGDRTAAYIDGQNRDDPPWYLYSSFIHPHPPLSLPSPWYKLYRPSMIELPEIPHNYEALLTYVNRVQNRYKYKDASQDRHLIRLVTAYYYGCISFIDYQVGRILETLERTNQLDDTLILFSSDHGEMLGEKNSYGKRSMHDGSARVPMIVKLPGRFGGGRVCDEPVNLVDLAPTFLGAAGVPDQSDNLDGEDMYDVLTGKTNRKYVFSQLAYTEQMNPAVQGSLYQDPSRKTPEENIAAFSSYMCVSREWKYFYSAPDNKEFFFDRIGDPGETRNLAGDTLVRQYFDEHKSALFAWLRSGNETTGLDGEGWRVYPRQEIDPDPDAGLLIQDHYTPWADTEIPGYSES